MADVYCFACDSKPCACGYYYKSFHAERAGSKFHIYFDGKFQVEVDTRQQAMDYIISKTERIKKC